MNPDQIRTVIRTFRDKWPEIFPGRKELPKTLIFAKTDSHADDIIQTVRQEFGEGNEFCRKITNGAKNPKSSLSAFRNEYYPRIAVTVDMIATGTDVKPLECLIFMRDVRSKNYFEQMKGRGTRVLEPDDLKKVTPSAKAKTHYVIVDAVGSPNRSRPPVSRWTPSLRSPSRISPWADDGRPLRGNRQFTRLPPLAPRQQARGGRAGEDHQGGRQPYFHRARSVDA